MYTDKTISCIDCGAPFIFSANEQEFYAQKGFREEPKRCKNCRENRKLQRDSGGDAGGAHASEGNRRPAGDRTREMFDAVCAACGAPTRVPFRPTGARPGYCRDCFANRSWRAFLFLLAACAALSLAAPASLFAVTQDLPVQTFDSDANGTGVEWGSSTVAWDGTQGNPAGALLITATFGSGSDTPESDYICLAGGNPWYQPQSVDLTLYKSVDFDIKWDNTSDITLAQFNDLSTWPTTLTNSLGQTVFQSWAPAGYLSGSTAGIDLYLCGPGGNQNSPFIGNTNIPAVAASGWVHMSFPINPATAGLAGQSGITIHKWINQQWGILNPVTTRVWIDNIVIKGTAAPPPPPSETPRDKGVDQPADANLTLVKSPIVGTFYEAASPGAAPFVRVGERVQPGKVLCIIESMKLMNEIEAETSGIIDSKLVMNGQPVEYGEALFAIRAV